MLTKGLFMKKIQKTILSALAIITLSASTPTNTATTIGQIIQFFTGKPSAAEITTNKLKKISTEAAENKAFERAQRTQAIAFADEKVRKLNEADNISSNIALNFYKQFIRDRRSHCLTYDNAILFQAAQENHKQINKQYVSTLKARQALGFESEHEKQKHSWLRLGARPMVHVLAYCYTEVQTGLTLADHDAAIEERDKNGKMGIFFSESDRTAFESAQQFEVEVARQRLADATCKILENAKKRTPSTPVKLNPPKAVSVWVCLLGS